MLMLQQLQRISWDEIGKTSTGDSPTFSWLATFHATRCGARGISRSAVGHDRFHPGWGNFQGAVGGGMVFGVWVLQTSSVEVWRSLTKFHLNHPRWLYRQLEHLDWWIPPKFGDCLDGGVFPHFWRNKSLAVLGYCGGWNTIQFCGDY